MSTMVEHLYTNRLIKEKSPYLLQHAHNPVDWYPWGEEAFEAARAQNKPIFLSIGYATCHWCHVMERESFENVEIAKLLNDNFISIKVDREELPEVDAIYMEFSQSMLSGIAGWPLNVILTQDLKPFFASTYLPPKPSMGLSGFAEVLGRVHELWHSEERDHLIEQAESIYMAFNNQVKTNGDEIPPIEQLTDSAEVIFKIADPVHGGIKGIPKFPMGYQWNFLLHYAAMTEDSRSLFLAERTLDMMQRGGIYDHLGGGFSRYSTDEKWLIPHFEKMLYDNALLSYSYLEAWQVTKRPLYREVCEHTLGYILREMKHPMGGFYSAEDADTEGHEGYYYTWNYEELLSSLGRGHEATLFCEYYGATPTGNFEGRNVLHTPLNLSEFAAKKGLEEQHLSEVFKRQRETLFQIRLKRPHPFKDDKILTSWNGLMLSTLSQASIAFGEARYGQAAVDAALFIRRNLWKEGKLFRRWRDGEASYRGGLEDYAFLIRGLLTLFETGYGEEWLAWAIELTAILQRDFKSKGGAFYQTDGQDSSLILRKCTFSDGAEPSGNAVHTENLLRLYQLTFDIRFLEQAEDVLRAASSYIENYAPSYCYHLMNLLRYYDSHAMTAVVALNEGEEHRSQISKLFFCNFMPHRALFWKEPTDELIPRLFPSSTAQPPLDGKTTLYLCQKGACQKPINDFVSMRSAIDGICKH